MFYYLTSPIFQHIFAVSNLHDNKAQKNRFISGCFIISLAFVISFSIRKLGVKFSENIKIKNSRSCFKSEFGESESFFFLSKWLSWLFFCLHFKIMNSYNFSMKINKFFSMVYFYCQFIQVDHAIFGEKRTQLYSIFQ